MRHIIPLLIITEKKIIESTTKFSVQNLEDISDAIIDLSHTMILSVIRVYSLDTSSASYELPEIKIQKLKKHLSRLLISKKEDIVIDEIYSCLFTFAYLIPINNAKANRKLVLSKKKKNNEKAK